MRRHVIASRRAILGLAALLWTSTLLASDKLAFGPPAGWVKTSAIPQASAQNETALQVLLLDRQMRFSGRAQEFYVDNAARIQKPQGLAQVGTVSFSWNPETDTVTVHKMRILRGDKVIDVLASGQKFSIARRETNLEYAMLDNTLTAIIQPAGLEVGDVLEIAYTMRRDDPVLDGTAEAIIGGWSGTPISRLHVQALWPESEAMTWRALDGLTGVQERRSGGDTALEVLVDDVQPVVQPKGAPVRFMVDPRIELSNFGSWSKVAAHFAPLYERATTLSAHSPLRAEIARMQAASSDPKERAALALRLVEDQVRYVFLGMNDGGFVPADVDITWSRRFGDCKAKTVLLLALLRALGIQAEPVLVSTKLGDRLTATLPMYQLFDHVLVRAIIGGKAYWLDGTRLGDRALDDVPVYDYHWGLPLGSKDSQLVKIEPSAPKTPLVDVATRVDATAGLRAAAPFHIEMITRGSAGITLNLQLSNLTANQLTEALRNYWSKIYPAAKVDSVSAIYDQQALAERLVMDGTVPLDWVDNRYHATGLDVGYEADFERPPGPNRDAPFAIPYPMYVHSTETLQLPNGGIGFRLEGDDVNQTIAGMEYHRHAKLDGAVFSGEMSQLSVVTEISAAEATAAQQTLRDLARTPMYVDAPSGHAPNAGEVADGISAKSDSWDDYATRGNQWMNRGKYDAAIEDFDAALAIVPNDATTIADRAVAYLWKQDIDHGRADVDKALQLDKHNPAVLDAQGMLAGMQNDFPAAISSFTASIASNPKDSWALGMRAESYWRNGDFEQALADGTQAIKLDPKWVRLYWVRAMVLWRLNRRDEASHQAQLVIDADPQSAGAYYIAGTIYAGLNDHKDAVLVLTRSINLEPTAAAYVMRAEQRPDTDLMGQRADLEAAVKLNPDSTRNLGLLAEVEFKTDHYSEAISSLSSAMKADGESVDLLIRRSVSYAKTHQADLAQKDLVAAQAKADNPAALNSICWTLATADVLLTKALEDCKAAVAKVSGKQKAHYLDSQGFVLMRLGRCDEALAVYAAALELEPLLASSLYGKGICEVRGGNTKDGRDDMKDGLDFSGGTIAREFARYGIRSP